MIGKQIESSTKKWGEDDNEIPNSLQGVMTMMQFTIWN